MKMAKSLNDLDQYGRRQNIRLNNVSLGEKDDCEHVVLDIINKALPIGESLFSAEISRCHPVGKPNRQVIITFVSYKSKAEVYAARFSLSNVICRKTYHQTTRK